MRILVDDIDEDQRAFNWHRSTKGYAVRWDKDRKLHGTLLHKVILERIIGRTLHPKEVTDHINHDRMDNRRSNLRVCSRGQNMLNNSPFAKSGYKGVYASGKGFVARITSKGKSTYLGYFTDDKLAAQAYNEAASLIHGEFAFMNKIGN